MTEEERIQEFIKEISKLHDKIDYLQADVAWYKKVIADIRRALKQ